MSGFIPPLTAAEVQAALGAKYNVAATLQTGGQGAVFKGTFSGGTVAVKVYHSDQLEERLEREISALQKIRGPTLVELCEAGTCTIRGQQCHFLTTTFIDGQPLDAALTTGGAQPPERVARIGHDVARALHLLWEARIVHRDIKPNNVMMTPAGGAVLIDLGVARHIEMTSLTTTGKTWGTSGYFSPEQARGAPLSCKSDVFALGVLLQECLLGRHPTDRRQNALLNGGMKTDGLRAGLPRFLVRLVDSMVNKSAVLRPSPTQVANDLAKLAGVSAGGT